MFNNLLRQCGIGILTAKCYIGEKRANEATKVGNFSLYLFVDTRLKYVFLLS